MQQKDIDINLKNPSREMYSDEAERAAQIIHDPAGKKNTTTQVRRIYDELVMFHDKVMSAPTDKQEEIYFRYEPLIQMLKAKVAYALGRSLVTDDFAEIMKRLLQQIVDVKTLHRGKLFFEAMLGFKRALEK